MIPARRALPLRLWLLISHLLVLVLPVGGLLVTGTLAHELEMEARGHLIHQGSAVAALVAPQLSDETGSWAALIPSLLRMEQETNTRVLLLDTLGRVRASTAPDETGRSLFERPEARVQVGLWIDDDQAGMDVTDDGPGIGAANLERVFTRFFTTGRAAGRSGLGLALAQTICRAHGGELCVQSRPGRTRFRVALPRSP